LKSIAKNKLYWICQIGGWFIFIAMELSSYVRIDGFKGALLINALVNFILGITVTHFYRLFAIKLGWLNYPLYKIIPRVIFSVFVMVSILTAINIPLDRYTYPIFQQLDITFGFLLGYFFNLSKFVLLWTLTYHLFQYWERSLLIEKEKYQLEAAAKENAYTNLKNQLNPHFLFNSLNSIRTLVDANPKLAKDAIYQLSSLLRSSLQTGKQKTIALKDELETVKHYLAIEAIRFDERLQFTLDISNDVLDCQVPPMMLQTLVENCVKHGISNLKNGGEILLKAYIEKNQLQISIINSGQYMPKHNQEGIGIANTRERLKILYDEKAIITIGNKNHNHVETNITIPL
jgi:two-component system LytT family sensor kinase